MPPNQAMEPTKGRGNASANISRSGCAALGGSSPLVGRRGSGERAEKFTGRWGGGEARDDGKRSSNDRDRCRVHLVASTRVGWGPCDHLPPREVGRDGYHRRRGGPGGGSHGAAR